MARTRRDLLKSHSDHCERCGQTLPTSTTKAAFGPELSETLPSSKVRILDQLLIVESPSAGAHNVASYVFSKKIGVRDGQKEIANKRENWSTSTSKG